MRVTSRALSAVLVLSLFAGGCGDGSEPSPTAESPSRSASSSPEPSGTPTPEEATAAERRYLERGTDAVVSVLAAGRPLEFRFTMGPEGAPWLDGAGVYEADPGRWSATTRVDPTELGQPGSATTMHVRSSGRGLWMQMAGWPEPQRGCWLQLERGQVPVGLLAMRAGEPVYVSALTGLTAGPRDGDVMAGGLGLQYALRLLTGQTVQRLDLTAVETGHHVPAELTFRSGRLASVLVRGADLRETLLAAGAVVPSSDEEPVDEVLDVMDVRLDYTQGGAVAPTYVPPPGTVVRPGQEGCRAE